MNLARRHPTAVLAALFALLAPVAAAAAVSGEVVAGHVVVRSAGRLGDDVVGLYRALGYGPDLLTAERIRDRLALDLGLPSAEGIDPHAPVGAVWVEDGEDLSRVPFIGAADAVNVRAGASPGTHVVSFGTRGGMVLAPRESTGRLVADYLERSGFDPGSADAVVSFRFMTAPFVRRGDAWLSLRADMLRGFDRLASILGDGHEDLRRLADALDDVRGLAAPWELFDGDFTLGAAGLRFRGRLAPRPGSDAAEWLAGAAPLGAVRPEERVDVALRFEWRGTNDAVARWFDLWRAESAEASPLRLERTATGVKGVIPWVGCMLPAQRGDGAGVLVRCSVAVDALVGAGEAGAPVHLVGVVEEGGVLGVELFAPIHQLRACIPRIEGR